MRDRANREYQVIQHPRRVRYPDGQVRIIIRVQLVSVTRQLRKRAGLSGRQWTRLRKWARRATKGLPKDNA